MDTLYLVARIVCVLLALAGIGAAIQGPRPRVASPSVTTPPPPVAPADATDLTWRAVTVMGLDPFSETRKAPSRRYEPLDPRTLAALTPQPPVPPPPRPEWHLTGVVSGSEPMAVFEGIDGDERARVLTVGDSVGPVRVERIAPDTVFLRQGSTAWPFIIELPWKTGGTS